MSRNTCNELSCWWSALGFCSAIPLPTRQAYQHVPFLPGRFSGSQMFSLFHLISTAKLSMNCQF
jgi:hypothetical protein